MEALSSFSKTLLSTTTSRTDGADLEASAGNYIAKIVSIGDSGTGKSSLTIRLCEGRFQAHHDVTIGVEFGSRIVPVGPPASLELNINNPVPSLARQPESPAKQKHMKLSLWDT